MEFNEQKLKQYLENFITYLKYKSVDWDISKGLKSNLFFISPDQEGYKETVFLEAQTALDFKNWNNSNFGSGQIIQSAKVAIYKAKNLVFVNQKNHFNNMNCANIKKSEEILYSIYCCDDDATAFEKAINFWGAKYDLIAYLFFIKNKEKYLPISPKNFDKKFKKLDIKLRMSYKCSFRNYLDFINYINELRVYMEQYFGFGVSLLDAHSVIWMMDSVEDFLTNLEETKEDKILIDSVNDNFIDSGFTPIKYGEASTEHSKPKYSNGHKVYTRNPKMSLSALYYANNSCEYNNNHESFIRKNSNTKYMEAHHLIPMSQYENHPNLDIPENIICLCSNCHNEVHYGKDANAIIEKLFKKREKHLKARGIIITLSELKKMY